LINEVLTILATIVGSALLSGLFVFLVMRKLFGGIMETLFNPMMKTGAKILGEKSGHTRAVKAVMKESAQGILQGPQLSGLRMIASQVGFDIDQMIEDHGAVETLAGLTQLLSMLGIDAKQLMEGGLSSITKGLLGDKTKSLQGLP